MSGVSLRIEAGQLGGTLGVVESSLRGLWNRIRGLFGGGATGRPIETRYADAGMQTLLAELRRRQNLRPALEELGETLVTHVGLSFREQRDPWGRPWQPLRPVTISRRRGSSYHILKDTGRLANSVGWSVSGNSVTVGTNVIYAATHQYGRADNRMYNTPRGARAPIPARPFFPIRNGRVDFAGTDQLDDILETLRDHLRSRA